MNDYSELGSIALSILGSITFTNAMEFCNLFLINLNYNLYGNTGMVSVTNH